MKRVAVLAGLSLMLGCAARPPQTSVATTTGSATSSGPALRNAEPLRVTPAPVSKTEQAKRDLQRDLDALAKDRERMAGPRSAGGDRGYDQLQADRQGFETLAVERITKLDMRVDVATSGATKAGQRGAKSRDMRADKQRYRQQRDNIMSSVSLLDSTVPGQWDERRRTIERRLEDLEKLVSALEQPRP